MEALNIIIMACQIGSAGMGGEYTYEHTILAHHKLMQERTMEMQRECQRKLIGCYKAKPPLGGDLFKCLEAKP